MIADIIRHGKVPGNLRGSYVGCRTDESLSPVGREELEKTRSLYRPPDFLYLSPMKRCIETALIIYPDAMHNGAYKIVDDLRECDFGRFEGRSCQDMENDPEYCRWVEDGGMSRFPGGESPDEFITRSCLAFRTFLEHELMSEMRSASGRDRGLSQERRIAWVVHGGTIMSILQEAGWPRKPFYEWHCENGEGFELFFSPESYSGMKRAKGAVRYPAGERTQTGEKLI